jgi:hypothetical protein
MRKRVQAGDIGHWTMIWGQPLNIWGVFEYDEDDHYMYFVCLSRGSARSHPNDVATTWTRGFRVSIGPCDDNTTRLEIVPGDDVPDWVSVDAAMLTLTGKLTEGARR